MDDKQEAGLTIHLTGEQVRRVNEWIGPINVAHFREECLPPGFEIVISFAGPIGYWASARSDAKTIDLGNVVLTPCHDGSWGL